jgi:hypothetical protein
VDGGVDGDSGMPEAEDYTDMHMLHPLTNYASVDQYVTDMANSISNLGRLQCIGSKRRILLRNSWLKYDHLNGPSLSFVSIEYIFTLVCDLTKFIHPSPTS